MPTLKPRYSVVETDDLREAMAIAAERWPELSRSQRLARLAELGAREISRDAAARAKRIDEAVAALPPFPAGYLEELREDWPG